MTTNGPVYFNEDPNHFVFERLRAARTPVTADDISAFIDQYRGTAITDFLICLNASTCWYPSKRTENAIDKFRAYRAARGAAANSDPLTWGARLMAEIYDCGLPLHQLWINRLRQNAIRPWISLRMNDIHGSAHPGSFLNSAMVDEHPEYCRTPYRPATGYMDHALDYLRAPVREYYHTVAAEALDTFDADGIEFDFMREITSVCIGREYEATAVLNDFMRSLVALVRAAEQRRGHAIPIAVRLPRSPELALRLGFDAFTWVREHWVDVITVTSRWASVDNDLPIDVWKRTFAGSPVQILAGLEVLCGAYPRTPRIYHHNTLQTALGSCCGNWALGADGIYLFNYMDSAAPHPELPDCAIENRGLSELLRLAGNRSGQSAVPRRHVVTYHDVTAPGCAMQHPLPATVGNGECRALRMPTGSIPADRAVRLVVGVSEPAEQSGLTAYVNAVLCRPLGRVPVQYPQYDDLIYYAFAVPNRGALPPITVAELGAANGTVQIHWCELQIQ